MKTVQINAVYGHGSTGIIVSEISRMLTENNIENYVFYTGRKCSEKNKISYMGDFGVKLNALIAKVMGNYGFNTHIGTAKLIGDLEKINPDVIHLHNIHGHNLNLNTFFKYLKRKNIRVIWTFHDCWAFTGYCTHFEFLPCEKWKKECSNCPQKATYSWFFDKSGKQFLKKKELFCSLPDMTIVTPSNWLAKLVKSSCLKDFPVEVINNGIDLDIFKHRNTESTDGFGERRVILGMPKGTLAGFLELNKILDKTKYKLVLAGLSENEIDALPDDITGIKRTTNRDELAGIYSMADVFVNFTMEDTFPTVNLEALACGTPIVTYRTGGSPETIDENTGIVVDQGDTEATYKAIQEICNGPSRKEACIKRAHDLYNAKERFAEYLELYLKKGRFE